MKWKEWINKLDISGKSHALRNRLGDFLGRRGRSPKNGMGPSSTLPPGVSQAPLKDSLKNSLVQFKNRVQSTAERTYTNLKQNPEKLHPRNLALQAKALPSMAMAYGDWHRLSSSHHARTIGRLSSVVLGSFLLAGTMALWIESLLPEPPTPPPAPVAIQQERRKTMEDYAAIVSRNIFNSAGFIPDENQGLDPNGPARKSTLPLNLIGTVVLSDPEKSIATIDDKGGNQVFAIRIHETYEQKITVKTIEHLRVTFINLASNALEYIEIPEEQLANIVPIPSAVSKAGGIEKDGENHFNLDRKELDKAFGNLSQILTQAKAVPNFENGVPNGFRIINIVPNSIYTKLGVQEGDVITAVNGESMADPGKAFELMNSIKSGVGHMEISLKSPDGKVRTHSYDIH